MKKLFKRVAPLLLVMLLAVSIAGCSSSAPAPDASSKNDSPSPAGDKIKVGFVADQAFDQSEWLMNLVNGVKEYVKEHPEIEINMIEATTASEYEPKIRALAESGCDIIITTYASTSEATINVAKDYPDIKFGSLDGSIENIAQYKNIEEFGLNRTQTAYLAGIVAAASTKEGKVGIVGGMDEPVINAIIAGWQQGLRSVKPDIKDYVSYAGTWTDSTTGKDLGLALVDKGCDVIAAAAGGTGAGTAQAAAETKTNFVAWDTHYDDIFSTANVELGAAVNYFDKMVIKFIENAAAGDFKAGQRVEYGISDGVCSFDMYDKAPVSEGTRQLVKDALKKIEAGEIQISSTPIHK